MFRSLTQKIIALTVIIAAIAGGYFYFNRGKKISYEFMEVKKGDIVQTVSLTGQVKPAENIELAFETGGKIAQINVKVGDKV